MVRMALGIRDLPPAMFSTFFRLLDKKFTYCIKNIYVYTKV